MIISVGGFGLLESGAELRYIELDSNVQIRD